MVVVLGVGGTRVNIYSKNDLKIKEHIRVEKNK